MPDDPMIHQDSDDFGFADSDDFGWYTEKVELAGGVREFKLDNEVREFKING